MGRGQTDAAGLHTLYTRREIRLEMSGSGTGAGAARVTELGVGGSDPAVREEGDELRALPRRLRAARGERRVPSAASAGKQPPGTMDEPAQSSWLP